MTALDANALVVVEQLTARIKRESFMLERLSDAKTSLTQAMDGLPHTQEKKSAFEKIVAEEMDLRLLVSELKIIRAACQAELCQLLAGKLQGAAEYFELQTLTYRYAFGKSIKAIADKINYSMQSVRRFHLAGLSKCGVRLEEVQKLEAEICY